MWVQYCVLLLSLTKNTGCSIRFSLDLVCEQRNISDFTFIVIDFDARLLKQIMYLYQKCFMGCLVIFSLVKNLLLFWYLCCVSRLFFCSNHFCVLKILYDKHVRKKINKCILMPGCYFLHGNNHWKMRKG